MCNVERDQTDVVLWQTVCSGTVCTCIYNGLSWDGRTWKVYSTKSIFGIILGLFADIFYRIIITAAIISFQTNA